MTKWLKPPRRYRVTLKDSGISHILTDVILVNFEGHDLETVVFTFAFETKQEDRRYSRRNVQIEDITDKPMP
jgi:hypothetical protein